MACSGSSQAVSMARAKVADYLVCLYKTSSQAKSGFISNLATTNNTGVLNAVGDLALFIQKNGCVYLSNNLTQENKARYAACLYVQYVSPNGGRFTCGSYFCDTGTRVCTLHCSGGWALNKTTCKCVCNKSCPPGTTFVKTSSTCTCEAQCGGQELSQNAFNYAMDAVAAQYLYYVTCNLYNRCDCNTYCNNATNRQALYSNFINNIKKDTNLQGQMFNLTCSIQKGNTSIQSAVNNAASRLLYLNGRSKKNCTGRPCNSTTTPPKQPPPQAPPIPTPNQPSPCGPGQHVDNQGVCVGGDQLFGMDLPTVALLGGGLLIMVMLITKS